MENKSLLLWKDCLSIIRDNLTEQQYSTWFKPIRFLSLVDNALTIEVPTQFFCEFLEEHFIDIISKAIERVFGKDIRLIYRINTDSTNHLDQTQVAEEAPKIEIKEKPANEANKAPQSNCVLDSQLNPKYNFNNFIEGSCNKLSRTVGMSIAEDPAHTSFNPLFIYGPSGVGKTHLVNAIGGQIKQKYPNCRVLYVSAHLFMVQFTDAVRNNTTNDFIKFYQTIDVLIIDDIQELSGLIKTQNTFFHIFNHLQQLGKQIIMTSDRTPSEMKGFEERMLTRFKWGMVAELERPNQDLRKAIITKKIKRDGLQIPNEVIDFIAANVNNSVRDLEGIINSLMAYSVVYNCDINMSLAERVVGRVIRYEKKVINVDAILKATCEEFKVTTEDIFSRSRKRPVAIARQTAMYLAQKYTDMALTRIGAEIGHRDHATVLHSIKQIKQQIEVDAKISAQINEIEVVLNQG
ncbi:MAG: chromosomal replication initiator protein DnaA [Bacteroidaceae bacterium]|nr:chromosomal replication initiator protein DnaA [Bacteroidaceae bacterium]